MGRELQKKKRRSGAQPVRRPKKNVKDRLLNNPIIRENWNKKETLTQNYRRLGLASRLNKSSGGTERRGRDADNAPREDAFAVLPGATGSKTKVTEVQIVKDPVTGELVVAGDEAANVRANPLNDPLNELDDSDSDAGTKNKQWLDSLGHVGEQKEGVARTAITEQLEAIARNGEKKTPRHQSEREREWVERMVGKHGDDYRAMFRDRKLNVMQQSEGDIKRRVRKWQSKNQK